MRAIDFEFNGRYLSDYGFMICDIGEDADVETVSAGGTVTIQTVRHGRGFRFVSVNAVYDQCIEAEFTICKNPCVYDDMEINDDEMRDLMRWLNRRAYYKMRFLKEPQNDDGGCYYNAAFNIDKICYDGKIVGLMLHMTTDSPFGRGEKITERGEVPSDNGTNHTIIKMEDVSDDIGYVYPDMELTVYSSNDAGDGEASLTIENDMFPGEKFEIEDNDYTNVIEKKYTVDGTSLTISKTVLWVDMAAYNSSDELITGVSNIAVSDNDLSTGGLIYLLTNGFDDGYYRFVVASDGNNGKKCILKRRAANGEWNIVNENISYIYNVFSNKGYIGIMTISFDSDSTLDIGSYITMKITQSETPIGDAFNYNFIKIGNTQDNRTNTITCNCACDMELSYEPIIKLSP